MTPLFGHDEAVAKLVARILLGEGGDFGECRAIGFMDISGTLVGGVLYSGWNPVAGTIEMTGASLSPKWASKQVYQALFDYPFVVCECQLVEMRIKESNRRLHSILTRWGFDAHPIARLFGRDENGLICTFTNDKWEAHPMNVRNRRVTP